MLNGIGALRGLRDNTGLTNPTKWTIMSQWRNLESKKDPKSYHCHSPGSVDTRTGGGGGGGTVGFRAVQRVEVEWWLLLLTTKKKKRLNGCKDQTQ